MFATDDDCALGALAAVRAALPNDVFVVGYGTTSEVRAAIAQGTALIAAVVEHPDTLGRDVIEVAASALRGNAVAPLIRVRVGLVDRDSLTGALIRGRPAGTGASGSHGGWASDGWGRAVAALG